MLKTKDQLLLFTVSLLFLVASSPTVAKLGETIDLFRVRNSNLYKFDSHTTKQDKHYYTFSMILTGEEMQAAPGLAAGITVTVVHDRIMGESIAVRCKDGNITTKLFGIAKALEFTYQAIGKPVSENKQEAQVEFNAFLDAANKALNGVPQNIKYSNFKAIIILSRTSGGDLVIAVTPEKLIKNSVQIKAQPDKHKRKQ